MHTTVKYIAPYSLLIFMCACSSSMNKNLSPPSDTKWVHVEIKNPSPYTKPLSLLVRYISYKCMKKRISGFDGSVITEPSYNVIQIPLQQQSGDLWKGTVAMTGGGLCQWALSAINIGIKYSDATHLGKELIPGNIVGTTVAFDDDASRNGQFHISSGNNLVYAPKYFPVIERLSSIKNSVESDRLSLFGKGGRYGLFRVNIVNDDFRISYQPTIDEGKKVEMIFPYEKKEGVTFTYVYPDGKRVSSKEIKPDFQRVEK